MCYTNEMDWDYIAGFIDGEGTLTFDAWLQHKPKRLYVTPMLIVHQGHPEVLERMQKAFGEGCHLRKATDKSWRLEVRGITRLLPVLRKLESKLIVKREAALALLEFMEIRGEAAHKEPYSDRCIELLYVVDRLQRKGRRRDFARLGLPAQLNTTGGGQDRK